MDKILSPYVKELLKGEIKWNILNKRNIKRALKGDKIIFIHIGGIGKVIERESSYDLFKNKDVINTINNNFFPILIDEEDAPEAHLIGIELISITETTINYPINIFTLPNGRVINSFSLVDSFEFLMISQNIINSFSDKITLLEKAANYLSDQLGHTGVVTKKESPKLISNKIIKLYVASWKKKMGDLDFHNLKSPYNTDYKGMQFLSKYNSRYGVPNTFEKIRTNEITYSCMNDPIDGGVFSQSLNSTPSNCLYEKSLIVNSQALMFYALSYKFFKEEDYKDTAINIYKFIKNNLKCKHGGYFNLITINKNIVDTIYYKYNLTELNDAFGENYILIAKSLGMDTNIKESVYQEIETTTSTKYLTKEIIDKLKEIRYKRDELLKDKRVISGYNFSLATSLCIASKYIPEIRKEAINDAEEIVEFFLSKLEPYQTSLFRYITCDNQIVKQADLYDNAFFLNTIIELYKLTRKEKYAILIKKYTKYIFRHYYQDYNGMFSKTPKNIRFITEYQRESIIDYTRYSANSLMCRNLRSLYKLTGKELFINVAKQQIYNIMPHLIGSGNLMVGWAQQILDILTNKEELEHPLKDLFSKKDIVI